MTMDDLIAEMDRLGVRHTRDGNAITTHGDAYLYSLTSLPEGVSLSAGLNLWLPGLTALPEGASLAAGKDVDLCRVTSLPKGVSVSANGTLDLRHLTSMSEGVSLAAGVSLYLRSLTALHEGMRVTAGKDLHLNRLTSLPEGVSLFAGRDLYLSSLTALPDGVRLSAGGYLWLNGLTSETQRYQGKTIRLRMIDDICTRLISSRNVAGVTLWGAQVFKGDLVNDKRCYVAQDGEDYARGDTPETALRDLRFKQAQRDWDPVALVAGIRARGTVTFNDYRLLTGVYAAELSESLAACGFDPDLAEMPLDMALKVSVGAFRGSVFARRMGAK